MTSCIFALFVIGGKIEMNNHPPPMAYGIRHNTWRPHQYETVRQIADSKKRFVVSEAVTGSGKSGIGMALAKEMGGPIRVITKSRSLQDQYAGQSYRADVLYGLAAYPCALVPGFSATECVFVNNMKDCPRAGSCGYLQAKTKLLESQKQVISFAYWFTAGWLQKEDYWANLYLDEAHEIPSFTMNYLEKDFDEKWARTAKVRLPMFPPTKSQTALHAVIARWLPGVIAGLKEEAVYLAEHTDGNSDSMRRLVFCRNEAETLGTILYQMSLRPEEMMVIVNDRYDFKIAPLTSRMFRFFAERHAFEKAIFTSATIGNPSTFMGGIGFAKDDYDFISVPSNFPPESMPVYVPDGAPKIGYNSSEVDLQQQARMIADIILQCPQGWSGFVHTASVAQSHAIANRLSAMDPQLRERVWVPQRMSSLDKIEAWRTRKMLKPNTIAISWDFWTGLDAPDDEINIVAKIPFGTLDVLGKARMDIDPKFYLWEAACKVEQATGRNRRGEPEHYEEPGQPTRRICAILDANIWRVYNQFSGFFKERIQAVKGRQVEIIRR
jgi:hypothetical protein